MIKAGIIGDDSLVCGELVRLLNAHPDVNLVCVASLELQGLPVAQVHRSLVGETALTYVDRARVEDLDVLLVCGDDDVDIDACPEGLRIIDLTPDRHVAGADESWTYGLSELNRKHMVRNCNRVVCPGDVSMAVLLALLPMARHLMLVSDIHVMVVQGGGDGVAVTQSPLCHDQQAEVVNTLQSIQSSFKSEVNIVAVAGAFSSGVLATVYMDNNVDLDVVKQLFVDYYDDHNFVFVVDHAPDIIDVLGTGKCYIHLERVGRRLVISTAIDGMLKGAASNAVHCMNLLFGLQECTGLKVKA